MPRSSLQQLNVKLLLINFKLLLMPKLLPNARLPLKPGLLMPSRLLLNAGLLLKPGLLMLSRPKLNARLPLKPMQSSF